MDDLKDIPALISNPLTWVVSAWLVRELINAFKRSQHEAHEEAKTFKDDVADALKENSGRLVSLTIALTKFESKLDAFEQAIVVVPKLAQDVSILFEKIRFLERRTSHTEL